MRSTPPPRLLVDNNVRDDPPPRALYAYNHSDTYVDASPRAGRPLSSANDTAAGVAAS